MIVTIPIGVKVALRIVKDVVLKLSDVTNLP